MNTSPALEQAKIGATIHSGPTIDNTIKTVKRYFFVIKIIHLNKYTKSSERPKGEIE